MKIVITVTEGSIGYAGDIPEGIEIEMRDYRPHSVRSSVQLGEELGQDDDGHSYAQTIFPLADLPF